MATLTSQPSLSLDRPAAPRSGLGVMVDSLIGSEILKIAAEVRALERAGRPVCNLTVGDFAPREFRIPAPLERAIAKALADGQTNYPPSDGLLALREAVQAFYARVLGLSYPLEGILIAGGARPLIYALYRALLDPGDTVVYPVPSWNNNHYAHLAGAESVAIRTRPEDGFMPDPAALEAPLRQAKLLVLNSPLNPAGTGFYRERLKKIARLVVEENRRRAASAAPLFLVYDQIYWLLAADDAPHFTPVGLVPEVAPYTIFVDGISKAFAATGLRVGWALGPPYVVSRLRDLLGHVGAWAPRPEQVATAQIVGEPGLAEELAAAVRDGVLVRMRALHEGLTGLAAEGFPVSCLPPAGALYLSAHFALDGAAGSNEVIRKRLLEDAGFAMVPFQAFGLDDESGWFRLSVGAVSVEAIAAAMPRLRGALARLTG
jgi:aspartate aminotransferase